MATDKINVNLSSTNSFANKPIIKYTILTKEVNDRSNNSISNSRNKLDNVRNECTKAMKPSASTSSNANQFPIKEKSAQSVSMNTKQYMNSRLISGKKQWQPAVTMSATLANSIPTTNTTAMTVPKIIPANTAKATPNTIKSASGNKIPSKSDIPPEVMYTVTKTTQLLPLGRGEPITYIDQKAVHPPQLQMVPNRPQVSVISFATPPATITAEKPVSAVRTQQSLQKVIPTISRISTAPNVFRPKQLCVPVHTIRTNETKQIPVTGGPVTKNMFKVPPAVPRIKNISSSSRDAKVPAKIVQIQSSTSTATEEKLQAMKLLEFTRDPLVQKALAAFREWQRQNDPEQKMPINVLNKKQLEFIKYFRGKANVSGKNVSGTGTPIKPLVKEMNPDMPLLDEVGQHTKAERSASSRDSVELQQKKKLTEHSGSNLSTNANALKNQTHFVKPTVTANISSAADIEKIIMNKAISIKFANGTLPNAHSFQSPNKTEPVISTYIDLTTTPSEVAAAKTVSTSSAAITSNGSNIQIASGRLKRPIINNNSRNMPNAIGNWNTMPKNELSLGPANIRQTEDFQSKFNQHIKQATNVRDRNVKSIQKPECRDSDKSKQTVSNGTNNPPPLTATYLDKFISWNKSAKIGELPNTSVVFVRNEFGMIEFKDDGKVLVQPDGRRSPPIYGKRRKQDSGESSQGKNLICGHKDFPECFDDIINRTECPNFITINRKPHEYYSTEYKDLVRLAIQRETGRCDLITQLKITKAMIRADSFKPTHFSNGFSWSDYIKRHANRERSGDFQPIIETPLNFFNSPFPCSFNHFVVGHKLEAIDPQNCELFCVCTVVEKIGFRIKLHFDGYDSAYDFWVNADSNCIFPVGWCNKTARELSLPYRRLIDKRSSAFDWSEYLTVVQALPAPRSCFSHLNSTTANKNLLKIGMKLEADDMKFTRKICVATIGDVIGNRVLITFDGLDKSSSYWTDIASPCIHPVNWHLKNGYSITSPPGKWRDSANRLNWSSYLRLNCAEPAPEYAFHTRAPIGFTVGMAIEIVDKRNPSLLRPATITMVDEYEIKVLFIGWPEKYAYWVDDDSSDIHPMNWAHRTGHPIEPPLDEIKEIKLNDCGIRGCTGIGNFKHPEIGKHTTLEECPYEMSNWSSASVIQKRVECQSPSIPQSSSSVSSRSQVNYNPALNSTQTSLQSFFSPIQLTTMSPKQVELFRRLQVSAKILSENFNSLTKLRDHWINKMEPVRPIQISTSFKNPLNWSVTEVAIFVSQLPNCSISMTGQVFIEHEIDGVAFLSLRQNDMVEIMGLSLGTALKVFNRILFLREECNAHYIQHA